MIRAGLHAAHGGFGMMLLNLTARPNCLSPLVSPLPLMHRWDDDVPYFTSKLAILSNVFLVCIDLCLRACVRACVRLCKAKCVHAKHHLSV